MNISIVVPCLNEERNVKQVYSNIVNSLDKDIESYEIIFVDDGSTDNTLDVLQEISESNRSVKIVSLKNSGYGIAVRSGFDMAMFEYIFYIDGDGQYDFIDYRDMLRFLADGYDLVGGYRIARKDNIFRKGLAAIGNRFFKLVSRIDYLADLDCGLKGIRKNVLGNLNLRSTSGVLFSAELYLTLIQNGFKVKQIPVAHLARKYGYSKGVNLAQYIRLFCDILSNFGEWKNFMLKNRIK
jgi:glycosyltransferase involved in cell wall biosynthesis